jgi:hypothetical protein
MIRGEIKIYYIILSSSLPFYSNTLITEDVTKDRKKKKAKKSEFIILWA